MGDATRQELHSHRDHGDEIACSLKEDNDGIHGAVNIREAASNTELEENASPTILKLLNNPSVKAIYFPVGTYTIASEISSHRSGTRLIGDRNGQAVIRSARYLGGTEGHEFAASMFALAGTDIIIQDLTFDQSAQAACNGKVPWDILTIGGANNVLVSRCLFTGGLEIDPHGDSHIMIGSSTRVRITHCRFENACDEGVYVSNYGCLGVIIEDCDFSGCGKWTKPTAPAGEGYCVGIKRGAELTVVRNNAFRSTLYGIVHERGSNLIEDPLEAVNGGRSLIYGNSWDHIEWESILDPERSSVIRW